MNPNPAKPELKIEDLGFCNKFRRISPQLFRGRGFSDSRFTNPTFCSHPIDGLVLLPQSGRPQAVP
jgi:hypothetical protein